MKFDTIIIGGGLSGLTCGISLAEGGQHVAIISRGQSSMFFSDGSFGLLGYDNDGNEVAHPAEAMGQLAATHPYTKMGAERTLSLARRAQSLLQAAGVEMDGSCDANHTRVTQFGTAMPAWLTIVGHDKDGEATFPFIYGRSIQTTLQKRFELLGGTYLLGDEIVAAKAWSADGTRLISVTSKHLNAEPLEADHFVLAAGVFDLRVDALADRSQWALDDAFDEQPFMEFGVATDATFRVTKDDKTIDNLFAIGSILSGHNSISLADKEGVSMTTALHVAETIKQ